MLKLQYTEQGLFLERITVSLEAFVAQRAVLVLRAGTALYGQPGRAAFLLPAHIPTLAELEVLLWLDPSQQITTCLVDLDVVEVGVNGFWMTEQAEAEQGIFLVATTEAIETLIERLWQQGQRSFSAT